MRKKQRTRFATLIEVFLVFVIFSLFGAWTVPDSNEPYYICKAIHFWQPDWIPNDLFLESRDSHWTFYVLFGWLSFFLTPNAMAWTGRFIAWGLLAWSWRRLSFALVPVRWLSVLTALALAYYVDAFNMAGEWILGGIEGKSFAFPFVFLGLEAMIRGRWQRTWIFLGIASAFHILVGGWSVLVAGWVWFNVGKIHIPPITPATTVATTATATAAAKKAADKIPYGLFFGGFFSLFGLIPALFLDYGVSAEIVCQAHQIYVFDRLSHHLVPYQFPWTYSFRFFLLTFIWILICRSGSQKDMKNQSDWRKIRIQCFEIFVWGTLILSLIGMVAAYGLRDNRFLAAEILRFYWFRLSDIFVPVGVVIGGFRRLLPAMGQVFRQFPLEAMNKAKMKTAGAMLGIPFLIYLLFDAVIFGERIYFTQTVAESCIPWALTILTCWGGLVFSKRFVGQFPFLEWIRGWGMILLYGVILLYVPFDLFKTLGDMRTYRSYSRIEPGRPYIAYYWIDVCRWISDPKNTPPTAKFLVPREGTTFKWHARRSDVGTWKNVPQDAEGIVRWQEMMHDLFYYRGEDGELYGDRSLTILLWWKTAKEIKELRSKYGFDYLVCSAYPKLTQHPNLQVIYENELYRVYRVNSQ